jgi:hypothetical protein
MVFGLRQPPGPLFERPAEPAPAETHHFRFRHLAPLGRFVQRISVLIGGVPRHLITVNPDLEAADDTGGVRCDCAAFVADWDCPHVAQAIHQGHVRGYCHLDPDPLPARRRGGVA